MSKIIYAVAESAFKLKMSPPGLSDTNQCQQVIKSIGTELGSYSDQIEII